MIARISMIMHEIAPIATMQLMDGNLPIAMKYYEQMAITIFSRS